MLSRFALVSSLCFALLQPTAGYGQVSFPGIFLQSVAGDERGNSTTITLNGPASYSFSEPTTGTITSVSAGADLLAGGITVVGGTVFATQNRSTNLGFYGSTNAVFYFAVDGPPGDVSLGINTTFGVASSLHESSDVQMTIFHEADGQTSYDRILGCQSLDGAQIGGCLATPTLTVKTGTLYGVSMTATVNTVSVSGNFFPGWIGGNSLASVHPFFYIESVPADRYTLSFSPEFGNVALSVPEPESYAMLLSGLGLLGVALRRRKQKLSAWSN